MAPSQHDSALVTLLRLLSPELEDEGYIRRFEMPDARNDAVMMLMDRENRLGRPVKRLLKRARQHSDGDEVKSLVPGYRGADIIPDNDKDNGG